MSARPSRFSDGPPATSARPSRFSDGPPPAASAPPAAAAPRLLPVAVNASGSGQLAAQSAARSNPAERSWQAVAGGLGGLAARFGGGEQSATVLAQAHASAWEDAGTRGGDRRQAMTHGLDQTLDTSTFDSSARASMDQHLPEWNRGYRLLAKMGWGRGAGLGRDGGGRAEPIKIGEQYGQLGLGKASEYEEKAEEATETRRPMTAEVIATEDDAARGAREAEAARQDGISEAIRRETSVFYCECCDKQYSKVTEYENHLSSYDHHHKKRFRDMQKEQRAFKKGLKATKDGAQPKKRPKQDPALLAASAAAAAAAAASAVALPAPSAAASSSSAPAAPPLPPGPPLPPEPPLPPPPRDAPPPPPPNEPPPPPPAAAAPKMSFGGGMRLGARGGRGGARGGGGLLGRARGRAGGGMQGMFGGGDDG